MADTRHLYLVATAAPPVIRLGELLTELTGRGWTTSVIVSPTAAEWIETLHLADEWGVAVRSRADVPYDHHPLPDADAILAAPLTFNSTNQWAAGASPTFAVGLLNEMLTSGVPIVAAPCVKPGLRAHPAYDASVRRLTGAGVTFLDPDEHTVRASDGLTTLRWSRIADRV